MSWRRHDAYNCIVTHVQLGPCPRCGSSLHPFVSDSRKGSGDMKCWDAEFCVTCTQGWWFQFPRDTDPQWGKPSAEELAAGKEVERCEPAIA